MMIRAIVAVVVLTHVVVVVMTMVLCGLVEVTDMVTSGDEGGGNSW